MIAIDANLLLYAYNPNAPEHARAAVWLERTLSNEVTVALPLATLLAFLRISTDPRIFRTPFNGDEATSIVADWLSRPNVRMIEPSEQHWDILRRQLRVGNVRGPRSTDAHLAALAIEHGATLYTNDRDFRVFPDLKVAFPLADEPR